MGAAISLAVHVLLVGAAVLLSVRAATSDVGAPEVTFFAAPPPPPPPPPAGSATAVAKATPKVKPKPVVQPDTLVQPKEIPVEKPAEAEPAPEPEAVPDPAGVAGGQEGGVPGGQLGGIPGGAVGGSGNSLGAKVVPAFVFDKERLSAPEPRFPQSFVDQNAGRTLRATYRICVRPDGRVADVAVISSSGMDQPIIEQIKATWIYKPQPVPVCTQRVFVFKFQ